MSKLMARMSCSWRILEPFLKFSHTEKDFNKFTRKDGGFDASHVNSKGETTKRKPKAGRIYVRNAGIM
jgi:hypothetical protein